MNEEQAEMNHWQMVDDYLNMAIAALLRIAHEDHMSGIVIDHLSSTRQMLIYLRKKDNAQVQNS